MGEKAGPLGGALPGATVGVPKGTRKVNGIEREEDTMKTWHVILPSASIVVAALATMVVFGSLIRYSVVGADIGGNQQPSSLVAWKLDRLTGKVGAVVLIGGHVYNLQESKITPEQQEKMVVAFERLYLSRDGGRVTPLTGPIPPEVADMFQEKK
jgi:hypothetical protein